MMFMMRHRRGGRRFNAMGMLSLVGVALGLAALMAVSFLTPTQVITSMPQAPDIMPIAPIQPGAPVAPIITPIVTTDPGMIVVAIIICALVFLALGVFFGTRLNKQGDEAEKSKNDDVVEKKKNRLTTQYAQTSDGAALEVVDDDGKSLTI